MSDIKTSSVDAIGSLSVDCTALEPVLIDIPPGARQGLRVSRPGFDLAVAEITANQANLGQRAGVTQWDIDQLTEMNRSIEMIDAKLPAAEKLVEMLQETRAVLDDRRHRQVVAIANGVEGRAKVQGSDELLARYQNTREYRSEVGVKAWQTRRRNERAANAEAPQGQVEVQPESAVDAGVDASAEQASA